MSVVTASTSKGEKSKKFQSLDINNIYQGSASKPQQKAIPQKHGLQSLGKIPTARRAPANLPSLKAENNGNDPTIAIVPAGSSGWAGKDEKSAAEKSNAISTNGQAKLEQSSGTEQNQNLTNNFHQQINNLPQQPPQLGAGDPGQPKTWRNVTQSGTRAAQVAASHARQNLLSHRSPLFGQEFPSLSSSVQTGPSSTDQEGKSSNSSVSGSKHESSPIADVTASQKLKGQTSPLIGSNDTLKYGPGPNLRPQTFGNWSFGGGSKINSEQTSSNAQQSSPQVNQPISEGNVNLNGPPGPPGLHSSIDPATAIAVNRAQQIQREISASQFQFDVSPKSPLILNTNITRKPTTSEGGQKKSLTPQLLPNNRAGGRYANNSKNDYRNNKAENAVFQQSIIDNEKLKRMDDFDRELNNDDWARSDETFDYNKKIASDDEDEHGNRAHPDWADQIKPPIKTLDKRIPLQSATSNHYEQAHNHSQSHRPRPLSSEAAFFDEDDQRRAKHTEVLKNIERAKRRREEEEQKYNKNNQPFEFSQSSYGRNLNEETRAGRDGGYYGRNQPARPLLNDERNNLNNRRSPGNYRSSHNNIDRNSRDDNDNRTSSNNVRSTFGKFDVAGDNPTQQQLNDHDKQSSSDVYEEKLLPSNDRKPQIQILQPPQQLQYDSGGGGPYVPRKQNQQQSSVPPRFKRNVGELHAFKRTSPPKETISSTPSSAEIDSNSNEGDKEMSPSSVRSQSSKEKDFGSLFRSSSGTSNSRKSPGNWDRNSNHSNAGSTMGGGTDKDDTDKNSTSSRDDHRRDNILQFSNTAPTSTGRNSMQEYKEGTSQSSHGAKDNNDNSDVSNSRLSQERSSAERIPFTSQADMPRPSHGSGGSNDHHDESRPQRDSRVRESGESYHTYEEGKVEHPYHMTRRAGASNVSDRKEHPHQPMANQGRYDRYEADNRDRRERNIKLGKPQNEEFRDRRDYDRMDRNRDKGDRDFRSSRGGRSNKDNRGVYGSRSESNVPGSFGKSLQTNNTNTVTQQKKIILPMKSSQGRNQQLLNEDNQESTFSRPKHASEDFENSSNITKDIESNIKTLTSGQLDGASVLQHQQTSNTGLAAVQPEKSSAELLSSEGPSKSESTTDVMESFQPLHELQTGEGTSGKVDKQNSFGGFAARGQPSRRGRGGLSNTGGTPRSFTRNDEDVSMSGAYSESLDKHSSANTSNKTGRASLPRTGEDEWESASDRSYEENAKRVQLQQGIDDKYYDRSKQQQRDKGVPRDNRKPDREDAYVDNRRRNDRDDARRGKYEVRGGMDRGSDKRGIQMDRNNPKQPNYDIRHKKQLPPRLAKQKEASRVMGGLSNPAIDGTGWGSGDAVLEGSSYQTWDHNLQQQSSQIPQTQVPQQQNQQQRSTQLMAGDYSDHHSMMQQARYGESGTCSIPATGDVLQHNTSGGESQHGRSSAPPVQTIIFENTNFKGGRGTGVSTVMTTGTTSVNDKMVFKSTVHPTSGGVGDLKPDAIQMPPMGGFVTNKNEDSDLKLDFTFEADISHNVDVEKVVETKSGAIAGTGNTSRSSTGHHPTEDLNMKIASVKKVWETIPSMSPVSHSDSGPNSTAFNQGFATSAQGNNDDKAYRQSGPSNEVGMDSDNTIQPVSSTGNATGGPSNAYGSMSEKTEGTPNVAKVRPQQVQQQHQQHASHGPHQHPQAASMMQAHQQAQSNQQMLEERVAAITRSTAAAALGPNNGNSANGNRFTGTAGLPIGSGALPTLQSPQSILNQPPSLYQAFQLEHAAGRGGMATNPLYSAYAGLGGQSVLLPSSGLSAGNAGNMFSAASAAGSQFRLQEASNATQFAAPTQQSSGNAVLLSQSSLMSSAMKQSNQIGPIGTKGGNGPFQQSGIGTLPVSGTSPMHLIQSDGQGYINYMAPNAMQRSAAAGQGPGQTAFYQALAQASTQQQQQQQVVSRHQAAAQQQAAAAFSNVQGFTNQQGLAQQQQINSQQAAHLRSQAAAQVAAAAGAPPPTAVTGIPYSREQQAAAVAAAMKQQAQQGGITRTESFGTGQTGNSSITGQTNLGQLQGHPFQQHQTQTKVSMSNAQIPNMSVLGNATVSHSNGPAGPTYSPTPIQRPHMGQGKPINDDDSMVSNVTENGSMKDKKPNEEN